MNKIVNFAKKYKIILFEILIVAIIFIVTLAQNILTEFACDDWVYMHIFENYSYPDGEVYRVKTLLDLLISTKAHWLQWNGRLVPHFLLQLVLMASYPSVFHKVLFNIINSGMYVYLGIIIYLHSTYKSNRKPFLLFGIYAMMWFFLPEYGATVLWASGAANYLWTAVIILTYLFPYRKYAVNHAVVMNNSIKNVVLMGTLGLFAGCTNENTGCALAFMCILFVVYYKINNIKIPKWSLGGIFGTLCGFAFLLASPGNRREGSLTYIEQSDFQIYLERFKDIVNTSAILLFGLLLILIISLFILLIAEKNKSEKLKDVYLSIIFILGAVASIGVLLLSARLPVRSWFLAVCLIITTIGFICAKIDFNIMQKKCVCVLAFILFFVFTLSHIYAFDAIYGTYMQTKKQQETIFETIQSGRKNVKIKPIQRSNNPHDIAYKDYSAVVRISSDRTAWANVWPAAYYGLDSIVAEN